MTLKDQFNVEGHDSTIGYVGRALKPAQADAALVKMLRSLGAIILAKTNLPQSIMVRFLMLLVNAADQTWSGAKRKIRSGGLPQIPSIRRIHLEARLVARQLC
jgi:hypothetical protein